MSALLLFLLLSGIAAWLLFAWSLIARLLLERLARRAVKSDGKKRKLWLFACFLATGLVWSMLLAATAGLVFLLYLADRSRDTFATTLLTALIAAALVTVVTETYKLSRRAYGTMVAMSLGKVIDDSKRERFHHEQAILIEGSRSERTSALNKIFREKKSAAENLPPESGQNRA